MSPVELTDGRGGGGGDGGAKLFDHEKAWFAINHSIPSGETLHFSGGGDEMVQICRSFRYISAKKRQNVKNFMRMIRSIVHNITSTGSTVCICTSYTKVHRFNTSILLHI